MSTLHFPWSEPPAPATKQEVLPGLDWIRLPLPFALDHVNCWQLHDDNECCLIDTGVNTDEIVGLWNGFAEQDGWPTKLLVTHFHPDHSGLAGWFAERGAQVFSSEIEWNVLSRLHSIDNETYTKIYEDWYEANDIDQSYTSALKKIGNGYKIMAIDPPATCEYLSAGDTIGIAGRSYSVLTGQGHSPDMVMLFNADENFLIAADQILPSITPNVSWMPGVADSNPLGSFINCLTGLRELPEETLVLPSHGLPFTGLHQRIDYLLDHHQKRLADIAEALSSEHTPAQLFPMLFKRKLDRQQLSFALGETLAHLKYMQGLSQVSCETRNGVDLYKRIT